MGFGVFIVCCVSSMVLRSISLHKKDELPMFLSRHWQLTFQHIPLLTKQIVLLTFRRQMQWERSISWTGRIGEWQVSLWINASCLYEMYVILNEMGLLLVWLVQTILLHHSNAAFIVLSSVLLPRNTIPPFFSHTLTRLFVLLPGTRSARDDSILLNTCTCSCACPGQDGMKKKEGGR